MLFKFFRLYKVRNFYEGTSLKRVISTRWEGHLQSTSAIHENYKEIVQTLREIVENGCKLEMSGEEIAKATGILTSISQEKFVFAMLLLKDLLQIFKPADKILQRRETGYVDALPVVKTILLHIESIRNDEDFEIMHSNMSQFFLDAGVQPTGNRLRSSTNNETLGRNMLRAIYFDTLNVVIDETKRRFEENWRCQMLEKWI